MSRALIISDSDTCSVSYDVFMMFQNLLNLLNVQGQLMKIVNPNGGIMRRAR